MLLRRDDFQVQQILYICIQDKHDKFDDRLTSLKLYTLSELKYKTCSKITNMAQNIYSWFTYARKYYHIFIKRIKLVNHFKVLYAMINYICSIENLTYNMLGIYFSCVPLLRFHVLNI